MLTETNTTKGSPSGGEGRADSVARHVAKATRRGRDAAGGERRKKMEEEEEEDEGRTKPLAVD